MKNRTRQHYVISPGVSPGGLAFVSWDLGEDPYQRASDYLLDEDTPAERCERPQRNWANAAKHLSKVWNRFVRQPLWRQAAKPVASV
ncbi:MAG: hypothetical protein ABI222_08170, partial [Opitutaceae bacterium]